MTLHEVDLHVDQWDGTQTCNTILESFVQDKFVRSLDSPTQMGVSIN